MLDFFRYIFLFFGICGAIVLGIALFSIYSKSYKPKDSLPVLVALLILFLVNGIMSFDALNRTLNSFSDSINFVPTPVNTNTTTNNLF